MKRRLGYIAGYLLTGLCGCLLAGAALAQGVTLDDLQQRFSQYAVIRAHFEQQRQIKDLPQPLRSAGEMIISRQHGVLWQQTTPFPMLLLLDQSHMVQRVNQQPAEVITIDSNPQLFQFNSLLRALFQADRSVLEQNFHLELQDQGNDRWQLRLTPTHAPLDKIFQQIVLQGQTYLNQIRLQDQAGDNTLITFSQQRTTPDKLTADEQRRFRF